MSDIANHTVTGRFAPTPSGPLHIGSMVAAVGSWLMARQCGGRWLVRIDDLDTPRRIPGMADDILTTLEAFGLFWDGPVAYQSRHLDAYKAAFDRLSSLGALYPCGCSRKEIAQSASAPHPGEDALPYPGLCRSGMRPDAPLRSWRVRVNDEPICFDDLRNGRVCQNLEQQCGDFVVRRADGVFAYQLAVVIDDHLSGVTQVVRGDDLLSSTCRQIHLQRLLTQPMPVYCHLPLVTGPQGSKLSKRDHLVSRQTGSLCGSEAHLLAKILHFLGQIPPGDLAGAPCGELLQWALSAFDLRSVPNRGSGLMVE